MRNPLGDRVQSDGSIARFNAGSRLPPTLDKTVDRSVFAGTSRVFFEFNDAVLDAASEVHRLLETLPPLKCRSCGAPLDRVFVDLGMMPIANAMRAPSQAGEAEFYYPLRTFVCGICKLVQIEDVQTREAHFHGEYTYFSSYSTTWLQHAERYVDMMTARFDITGKRQVVEIASNDGYLLQYFKARGVPVLGIDPAANCAEAALRKHGVETITRFFGVDLARDLVAQGRAADLIVANNVLAHVPDLNDFVEGLRTLLKPDGVITIEFPHLLRMMEMNYFDTIYHEHFSYLSLLTIERLLSRHGLMVIDLEELTTHGGSLRLFARPIETHDVTSPRVQAFREKESAARLDNLETYSAFADNVRATKRKLLKLLIGIKDDGRRIAGYGAPAKGNTLLNYCGIGTDMLEFTADVNPHKQGLALPGSGIRVYAPERIFETKPDYVLILPWNIKEEIMEQLAAVREWGGRFIVPMPEPTLLD